MNTQFVETEADNDNMKRALRTVLPMLRSKNYIERWAEHSPAIQALNYIAKYLDQDTEVAGDLVKPVVEAHNIRPIEDEVEWVTEYMLSEDDSIIYFSTDPDETKNYAGSYPKAKLERHLTADLPWEEITIEDI